jgi:hypothetical protein
VSEAKPTALENFREAAKKIISVSREEILKREEKYQAARKTKSRKKHR